MAVKGNASKRYPNSDEYNEAFSKIAENHINNKSNPHGTTAEQVGAAEKVHEHDTATAEKGGFLSPELLSVLLASVSREALDKILESYYNIAAMKEGYFDKSEVRAFIDSITVIVDHEYNKNSDNAQSGKAVAQAVSQEIARIIDSSDGMLDTLSELAKALGNDPNFATTVMTEIGKKANADDVYSKVVMDSKLAGKVGIGEVLTPSETEAMFLRYNSQVHTEVDHKIAVSEANIDKKVADNQAIVTELKGEAETATSEAKEAKTGAESAAESAQALVDAANARLDNVYSRDEADVLLDGKSDKNHVHEKASHEKGVPISLDGLLTPDLPEFVSTTTDDSVTSIEFSSGATVSVDYQGEADIVITASANLTWRSFTIHIDDVLVHSGEMKEAFCWQGKIEKGIKIHGVNGITLSFQRFFGTTYTNGFMTGEDKEKLDNTYRKDETLSKEETASAIAEAVAKLVDSSPETLDTLKEVATALGDDPNFATTIMSLLGEKANSKDVYSAVQTDAKIEDATKGKANASDVEAALNEKANAEDVYSKDKSDVFLGKKADKKEVANALIGQASGEVVQISDVSPIEHKMSVKVSGGANVVRCGKNLIPFPYPDFSYNSGAGITATVQDDGGILINGTATANVFINLVRSIRYGDADILPNSAKGLITNGDMNSIYCRYDVTNATAYVYVKSGTVCDNIVFYPQLEAGTQSTEYEIGIVHETFAPDEDGFIEIPAIHPVTSLYTGVEGVTIEAEYHKDLNKNPYGDKYVEQVEYNSTDGALQGRVYVVDKTNTQTSRELRITAKADSIPLRNANGNFYVNNPTNIYECTPKGYVDTLIAEIVARLETGGL